MQAARTFMVDELPDDIEPDLRHTYLVLLACRLTTGMAGPFAQLLAELDEHTSTHAKLGRDIAALEAMIPFLDDDLNVLLDEAKAALVALGDRDVAAALHKQLFGNLSPSELRRFLLGDQLDAQRLWPGILSQTMNAKLQDIGDRTIQAVAAADRILSDRGKAQTALDQLTLGPWTTFIASCNAARATLFGELLKLTRDLASGPLPPDFVDRFFLRDTNSRAPRLEEVERTIARLTNQLTRLTARRDMLEEKKKSSLMAKKKGELTKKKAQLLEKQKGMKDEQAEIAALEAEIAKEEA